MFIVLTFLHVWIFVCAGEGEAYEEPRLTCWYGELSYTYAHSTMTANTQVTASETKRHAKTMGQTTFWAISGEQNLILIFQKYMYVDDILVL